MTNQRNVPSILVVCLGNICRSPTAEAVLRARANARQVRHEDLICHDMILAADDSNLADLKAQCPESEKDKLSLFLSWGKYTGGPIPDPYYGGDDGFEYVLDLLEQAADGVLDHIASRL